MTRISVLVVLLSAAVIAVPYAARATEPAPVPISAWSSMGEPLPQYIGQCQGMGALFNVGYGPPGTGWILTPVKPKSSIGGDASKCSASGSPRNACSATATNVKCSTKPGTTLNCSSFPGAGTASAGNECSAYGNNSGGNTKCSADSSEPDAGGTFCSATGNEHEITICSADNDEPNNSCSATGGGSLSSQPMSCSTSQSGTADAGKGAFCSVTEDGGAHQATCTHVTQGSTEATCQCSSEGEPQRCSILTIEPVFEGGYHVGFRVTARSGSTSGVPGQRRTICSAQ